MNTCEVCHRVRSLPEVYYIDLNFTYPVRDPRQVVSYKHGICYNCFKETKRLIEEINKGPVEELPLYISDKNVFIRDFAARKLKGLQS